MKCKRPSDGRALDHHTLQVMRQQAVKAVREGQTVQSVAAAYGVNERSVFRWLADFADGGQNALLAKPIPGRPSKVNAEELSWIANAVRDHNPQQFKFEFGLWTLSLIRHLIKRQFKKELSVSSVHRLMRILGFSAQKPLYQAWQQDPVLVRTWETETYPAIRAEAKRVEATIYFGDESGIRSDYHTGTTWAPQGQTPVVQATGRRFSLNMISAVSTQGEFRFMLHEGSVGAKVFVEFLKRLMVNAEKPVFLIVDGHPIHKAKMVKSYVEGLDGKLKLFYLPPYSPHLNPDETVWAHVKRKVSRQLVESAEDMKRLALGALRSIQKLPELVKSFFRQPECRYILE
ncbi:IS630 family transposase [Accumulibacter sp.]|jgi:transposase|uniref:IS630 family transposase n=1 Tax=Accumulibacter sp. TaxID=2053492 RepID=UPI00257B0D5E|nr:IS630 family transposase [Accumulibacter sp.]MDS4056729.1 IS630 family transposase [Accumulibacter sp.]